MVGVEQRGGDVRRNAGGLQLKRIYSAAHRVRAPRPTGTKPEMDSESGCGPKRAVEKERGPHDDRPPPPSDRLRANAHLWQLQPSNHPPYDITREQAP